MTKKVDGHSEKMPPIPENLDDYLTDAQKTALVELEQVGWHIAFVRRKHIPPIVVVTSPDREQYGVLLDDGEVDFPVDLKVRSGDVRARGVA